MIIDLKHYELFDSLIGSEIERICANAGNGMVHGTKLILTENDLVFLRENKILWTEET